MFPVEDLKTTRETQISEKSLGIFLPCIITINIVVAFQDFIFFWSLTNP